MNFRTNDEKLNKDMQDIIKIFGEEFEEVEISHEAILENGELKNRIIFGGELHQFSTPFVSTEPLEDRRQKKRHAKSALFSIMASKSKREVLWGALTGIRPVKLYKSYADKGLDAEQIFRDNYFVKDKKIAITKEIYNLQKTIVAKGKKDINMYVGIPFCASRCYYCSFISENINRVSPLVVQNYVDVMEKDIKRAKQTIEEGGYNLRSIYIGGGTPSSISAKQMEQMFRAIGHFDGEYTFEGGRADTLDEEKIKVAREYANRISVNPQTANDETLKRIGRSHTYSDFLKIFEIAKKHDFLINSDLICGLYGESFEDFQNTMEKMVALDPQNITIHTLCLKAGSKYKEKDGLQNFGDVSKMVDYGYGELKKAGYNPYYLYRQKYTLENLENCGFAKPNCESIYNIDIMQENTSIISCGAHGISKTYTKAEDRLERIPMPKDVKTYMERAEELSEKRNAMFLDNAKL